MIVIEVVGGGIGINEESFCWVFMEGVVIFVD